MSLDDEQVVTIDVPFPRLRINSLELCVERVMCRACRLVETHYNAIVTSYTYSFSSHKMSTGIVYWGDVRQIQGWEMTTEVCLLLREDV